MAKRIITQLIDDLDRRSDAARTIRFGINGRTYEIDLSAQHAEEFTTALEPFVRAARTTRRKRGTVSAVVRG